MANYIYLTLDTTPPLVEIYAPLYTTPNIFNHIRVVANETLAANPEIYIVDSLGNRFDLTLNHHENEFEGFIRFNELSLGLATIHAIVKDEVWNQSNEVTKTFEIKDALAAIQINKMTESVKPLKMTAGIKKIGLTEQTKMKKIKDSNQP